MSASSSNSGDVNDYLKRPEVANLIEYIVSQCIAHRPEDPASFIVEDLIKTGKAQLSTQLSGALMRDEKTATPPVSPQQPVNSANEEMLQWIIKDTSSPTPVPLPQHLTNHPLASTASNLGNRLRGNATLGALHNSTPQNGAATFATDESAMVGSMEMDLNARRSLTKAISDAMTAIIDSRGDEQSVAQSLASAMKNLINADRCTVYLADDRKQTLTAQIQEKTLVLRYGEGFAGTVAKTRTPIRVDDAYEDKRFCSRVDSKVDYVTRSLLTLPMLADNTLIAVVQLINKKGEGDKAGQMVAFGDSDEQLFQAFMLVAGVTLRNVMFFRSREKIAKQNAQLAEITATLANNELDEAQLIPSILKSAKGIVGCDRCSFFSVNDDGETVTAHLEGVRQRLTLKRSEGVVGWVLEHGTAANIPDCYKDRRFNTEVDAMSGYRTTSMLAFPIQSSGKTIAVVQLINKFDPMNRKTHIPFTDEDVEVLSMFAPMAGVCMRHCSLFSELQDRETLLSEVSSISEFIATKHFEIQDPSPVLELVGDKVADFCKAAGALFYLVEEDTFMEKLKLVRYKDEVRPSTAERRKNRPAMGKLGFRGSGKNYTMTFGSTPSSATSTGTQRNLCTPTGDVSVLLGRGMVGGAAAKRRVAFISDVQAHEQADGHTGEFGDRFEPQSALLVPILENGHLLGVCAILDPDLAVIRTLYPSDVDNRPQSVGDDFFVGTLSDISSLVESSGTSRFSSAAEPIHMMIMYAAFAMRIAKNTSNAMKVGENLQQAADLEEFSRRAISAGQNSRGKQPQLATPTTPIPLLCDIDSNLIDELVEHEFNVWQFVDGMVDRNQLITLLVSMFESLDLFEVLNVDEVAMGRFIAEARNRYRDVPYHNFNHAFDVCQTIFAMLHQPGVKQILSKVEVAGLMLAAVVHDIDHSGLNNAFHLKAQTTLGILSSSSGNKSVMELHHCQVATELLSVTGFLNDASVDVQTAIHKTIINCVLATDMALHKDYCAQIEAAFVKDGQPSFDPSNVEHRRLLQIMLLKMADISNVTKPFDVSRRWGIAVTEEFYVQGDAERSNGLEVTPMFDRQNKAELAKGQIGFIQFMCRPWYVLTARAMPQFEYMVEGCDANIDRWKRIMMKKDDKK